MFRDRPEHVLLISEDKLKFLGRKMRELKYNMNYKKHKIHLASIPGHLVGKKIGNIDDEEYMKDSKLFYLFFELNKMKIIFHIIALVLKIE